jgi:hypothetical protein
MRVKALLTLPVLLLCLCNAKADWLLLVESENTQIFVERSEMLRKSESSSLEYLLNFKTPQFIGEPVFSAIDHVEIDCAKRISRSISRRNFTEHMANGRVISFSSKQTGWKPVSMEGMHRFIWDFVCEK